MKILFEEYKYQTKDVVDILGSLVLSGAEKLKEEQQLRMVGYFFSPTANNNQGDMVFILPKVLMDSDQKVFGLDPLRFLQLNWKEWKQAKDDEIIEGGTITKKTLYDFVYGFSTWMYRAIDIYRKNRKSQNKDEDDFEGEVLSSVQVGKGGKRTEMTFMDIILSLIDFQRTHKNFITFVMRMAHSGCNNISWTRTIAKTSAILQDEDPIYLDPINKKREVNFDEELLIIYYSILNYIKEEYGFPIQLQTGYKLITGAKFIGYRKSLGLTRLRRIRYKYYSDDAILLWNLCYAFFAESNEYKANANRKDFLLVRSFHVVFEAMIDELVGDKDLPRRLKVQSDDKRIDHLYTYRYLLEKMDDDQEVDISRKIYHIADSKYYNRNTTLKGHDVPKQFTYERNVIQWHMDLLHDIIENGEVNKKQAEELKHIPIFDEITEGYNVIPNFFISAKVDENLDYEKEGFGLSTLEKDGKHVYESYHFWERLFDRSTMFTLHYDVNFLYVLKKYSQNRRSEKEAWKKKVRKNFREKTLEHLNNTFDFYQILIPENDIEAFVDTNFKKLSGKLFSFMYKEHRVLLYAERKMPKDEDRKPHMKTERPEWVLHLSTHLEVPTHDADMSQFNDFKKVDLGTSEYDLLDVPVSAIVEVPMEERAQVETVLNQVTITDKEGQLAIDFEHSNGLEEEKLTICEEVEESEQFVKYLPFYSVKAACGEHYRNDLDNDRGWIEATSFSHKLNDQMFVIQAVGHSMEDKIFDGDYCVFEWYSPEKAGSREGIIVLAKGLEKTDPDYVGRYTIKKYHKSEEKGKTIVTLLPLNKDYDPIPLHWQPEMDSDNPIKAIFVGVLKK